MKCLEQYIEANAIYEELVNMEFVENDMPIDEGILDWFKKLSGKFSKAKTAVKATGNVMTKRIKGWYKDAFPEWWKEYEKLSQEEDEKKRSESVNKILKDVEASDALDDKQKAEIKMILLKQQVDLSNAAGQEESAKAAEEQLKKEVQEHPEQGKTVTKDLQGAGYKAPDGEGGDTKLPPTVQKASEKTDELQQNVDTLSEKDPEIDKAKQELDKAKENDKTTSADLRKYMEEMFSKIDNSENLSDADKIAEKLNLVMLQLSMFGLPEDDDKHRDMGQFKEFYNYLTKTLGNLNQENKDATKQYLDSINKGEVPDVPADGKGGEGQPANDGKPTDDPSQNLGTNDENAVVTPEQEKTGVQQTIKDEANFISPLAKRAGIDGQALSNYVTGIINKAFKEPVQDEKTGEAVLKWKNGAVQSIAQNDGGETRLVDGISAIISGLLILKSQNAIDAVLNIEELDPKGVSGKLNKLQKELSQVDAGVKEHRISLEDFVNKK